jgi:hypothetical protein
MRRFTLTMSCVIAAFAAGCVEGEQTYTFNPDGSGKVTFDIVLAPPFDPIGGDPGGKSEDLSIDQLLQRSLKPLLQAQGITGWRDVSASFAPDGRLKFAGTAFFKNAADVEFQNVPLLGPQYVLSKNPDGSLSLTQKKKMGGGEPEGPGILNRGHGKKSAEELAKMTDQQLDAYIMKERIEYQSTKSLLIAMLADAKLKTTFIMPGQPEKVTGFKTDGQKVFSEIDGNRVIAGVNKVYAMQGAEIRKIYRSREAMEAVTRDAIGFIPDESLSATIAKPTGPQFDYAKEVAAARAAYPELRKKLNLDPSIRLPESDEPPGFPPK